MIVGSALAPWLADRYLARTNVDAQQTEQPLDPDRSDYLYGPLGDRGTHGPFDDESRSRSLQLALVKRRRALGAGAALLAAAVLARRVVP